MISKFVSSGTLVLATIFLSSNLPEQPSLRSARLTYVQEKAESKVSKEMLNNIRAASVSIEINEKFQGSGTLIEKDGEMYCLTAAHVIDENCKSIRITQHGKNPITIYASLHKIDREKDYAILKVGTGVFTSKMKFHKDKQELDTPIVHCGSMVGMHHTTTRGTLVGVDRKFARWKCVDQLDITAYYGSSGGGVFDHNGNYIGMIVGGVNPGIVFMVPSREIDF